MKRLLFILLLLPAMCSAQRLVYSYNLADSTGLNVFRMPVQFKQVKLPTVPYAGSAYGNGGSVYIDTTAGTLYYYSAGSWHGLAGGGGSTPTLQQVTDVGDTTNNSIIFKNSAETVFGSGGGILLDNNSRLREGTITSLNTGNKGIAQICGVGYELKWAEGSQYVMNGNGNAIRVVNYRFNDTPTSSNDNLQGFYAGSRWVLDNGITYVCADATTGSAVWNRVSAITLTTTGTSGAATLTNDTLNIPQYAGATYTAGNRIGLNVDTFYLDTAGLFAYNFTAPSNLKLPTTAAVNGELANYVSAVRLADTAAAIRAAYVPYTGATQAVNLGNYDLTVHSMTVGKGNAGLSHNTVTGYQGLFHITSGNYNTSNGYQAGHNITTGNYNTAIGQSALYTNTTGGQNTAVGLNALLYNLSATGSTAIGVSALEHNSTGAYNIGIGYNAGSHITGGVTVNATSNNSIYIGRDTRALSAAGTNEVVIGGTTTGNGSNTVTIGNSAITNNYFNGAVNAGSFVKSGGTSAQYLMADGSTSTLTGYATTSAVADSVSGRQKNSDTTTWDATKSWVNGRGFGTGTVTSVAAANGYGLSISGSPVTGTGTITATVDSGLIATRLRVKKQIDSVAALGGGGGVAKIKGVLPVTISAGTGDTVIVSISPNTTYQITEATAFTYSGANGLIQKITMNNALDTVTVDTATLVEGVTYELRVIQGSGGNKILHWGQSSYILFQGGTTATGRPYQDIGAADISRYFIQKTNALLFCNPVINNRN